MSNYSNLTLYGAVTSKPNGGCEFNTKQIVRQSVERLLFRTNFLPLIDYRNYVNPGTFNLGDYAISIAANQQASTAYPDININHINWTEIESSCVQTPILIAGSGYFFIESSKTPAKRIGHDVQFIQQNNIPTSYFGVGVNYVGKNENLTLDDIRLEDQKTLTASLEIATSISVRDATSKAILQPLTDTPIVVTGDPALFIKSNRIRPNKPATSEERLTVDINIPFHGPAASIRVSKDLKAYIQFFKSLQNDTNCDFIQTVHFYTETLIGKIMQDHGIRLTQTIGDVQTLLNAYQQMDFHIGGMLHSCILSASVGTPCIGLAYDIKHQGFFDLIGQPDLCIPAEPFDPDRLGAACDRVIGQRKNLRAQINARRDELEVESDRFLGETLQKLLN